jgi:hypothetical protein
MKRGSQRVAIAVCAAAFAIVYAAVAGPAPLVFGLISQTIFLIPGVLIVRAITPGAGWLAPLAFGPLIGQALGSLALTGLWIAGERGPWLIVVAAVLVAMLMVPARKLAGRFRLPATEPGDAVALALLLLVVPIIVGVPFAHVGEITANGQDYRAYFTADYVWRRAVVSELAKGDVLPVNPFYAGDPMHYYWMPHVLSAVQYRFAGGWATLDELLLIRSISIDAVLMTFLYGMVRTFGVRPWASATGVAFVVLSSSFEGLYALFDYARNGVPLRDVKNLNIDAISRWWFQGIPIDGLQRLLFYQPHHAVGYGIGMIGLLAIARRERARDGAAFAIAGICLGLSIAISSFAGGMLTVAAAIYEGAAVMKNLDLRRAFVHAIAAAIPLAAAVALTYGLRYVDTSGSVVAFELNRMAARDFWRVTLLSFGPVLLLSMAAIPWLVRSAFARGPRDADFASWGGARASAERVGIFGALAVSCVIFYFFVNVRDHQDVYVGWRVGHFLFISATVVIAILFERLAKAPVRPLGWAAVAVLGLMGLPTTAIDVYNTQDITNHGPAPAGNWTLRLTPDDRQVFAWIKDNTDPKDVFQVDPVERGSHHWAYLPAFAERRMAAGLPISMIPLAKYEAASNTVRQLYEEAPLLAYERAVRANIDYIIVGPQERAVHPGVEDRFDSVEELMPVAFRNGTISIYRVAGRR